MVYYLISFDSTHQAIKAETYLKQEYSDFRIIPTPGQIKAGCGLTIKTLTDYSAMIEKLDHQSISWQLIYQVDVTGQQKTYTELRRNDD